MSIYSVKCVGCEQVFELNCKNCDKNTFIDSSKDPSKKNLKCTNCGTSVTKVQHKCFAWFSDPKPTKTDIKASPNNFINLSKKSTTQKNVTKKKPSSFKINNDGIPKAKDKIIAEERRIAENLRKEAVSKANSKIKEKNKEKIIAEERRIAENLRKEAVSKAKEAEELKKNKDPINVHKRQIDEIQKNQEQILNDLESNGCLHFLLSNNELQDYAKNTGIELNIDQSHYELMYQIELAEGTLDTSQANWNFKSMDKVIAKRYSKLYKYKVKYVKSANRQLNELKSRLDEAKRIKQKHDEKNLEESIHKYKIELELNEKRIAEKKKAEERRIDEFMKAEERKNAENLRKVATSKAKENLKKRFF